MLTKETEAKISKILVTLSEGEKNIENSRRILSENIDFDALQIFRYLDREGKNIIDSNNIQNFLKKNGIYTNKTEIDLLIMFYDEDNDGCLSYYELLNLIQSTNVSKRSNPCLNYKLLPQHIENLLVKLLDKEIDLSRSIVCLLTDLKTRPDFKMQNIYHALENCGVINYDSIKFFLDRNCIRINKNDIFLILKKLDFNKDGVVDLCEFNKFIGYPNNNNMCNFNSPKCNNINSPKRAFQRSYIDPFPNRKICCDRSNVYTPMRSFNDDYNNYNDDFDNENNNNFIDENISQSVNISPRLSLRLSPKRIKNSNRFINNCYSINSSDNFNNQSNEFYSNPDNYVNIQKYFIPPNNQNSNYNNQNNFNNRQNQNINPNYNNNSNIQNQNNNQPINNNRNYRNENQKKRQQKKNPILKEETQFIEYLKELMEAESQLEQSRIDLSLKTDFTCQEAFKIFEQKDRGFLSDEDLKYGFEELGVCINDKDINLLLKRFDIENEGVINYNAFFDMIVPFEKDYRNMVENRPSNSNFSGTSDVFMLSTKNILREVFNLILNYENRFNEMKKKLASVRSVLKDIFMHIDRLNVGYFTNEDLINYLKKNNIFTTLKDADLLFIRFDRNRNGQVDFEEVEGEMQVES